MRIFEIENIETFYHGSMEYLPVGTILTPRDNYEEMWGNTAFYAALEYYRPEHMLSHKESVFMCIDEDDVDLAGGGTEWLFKVKPLGKIEKHDLNWGSEVSMFIDEGYDIKSKEVKQASLNYWNGIPHTGENVWEFLTPKAQILHVERY